MATGTGVAVNGGGGGDEREDGTEEMASRCLTGEEGWEGEEGEERKGSELGGNKVSLIPSLFFRQPSFLMEIVLMEERISLQFFPLFSFFSLFSFLPFFFFFIFIITGYQSPSLRVYRYTREWKENWLEASSVAS